MLFRKLPLLLAAGAVLLFSEVAFSQPVFAPPVNLGPKINSPYYESDPFLTADGKKLFFVSARDGTEDIWYSEWTDTGWTNATILGPQINSFRRELSPSVSPDGKKLYYVDAERDGYLWDIWVSTWNSSINDWGTPQNLGGPVNTSGVEHSAHIAPDGQHLYFTSLNGPDSLFPSGRCGMYVSEWDGSSWSVPTAISQVLDRCGNDPQYPSITADGRWLYYERVVSDGLSIFVSEWDGFSWKPPVDLRSQLGGRAASPSITPNGSRLFFSASTLGGYGGRDIWVSQQLNPLGVPTLQKEVLFFLVFTLALFGIWYSLRFEDDRNRD